MINNSFKQIVIPSSSYSIEDLTKDFLPKLFKDEQRKKQNLNIIRPYKIMISAPPNTWLYFNNDISPVVINETGTFTWDLSSFGTFNSLYFVFNESKYAWDDERQVWMEDTNGVPVETIWENLTGYDISAITNQSENTVIAIFCAALLTKINELNDTTIEEVLETNLNALEELFYLNIKKEKDSIEFEDWLKQFKSLLEILNSMPESQLNKKIFITGFYYELKANE